MDYLECNQSFARCLVLQEHLVDILVNLVVHRRLSRNVILPLRMLIWRIIFHFNRKPGFISDRIRRDVIDILILIWIYHIRLHRLLFLNCHYVWCDMRGDIKFFSFLNRLGFVYLWLVVYRLGVFDVGCFDGWESIVLRKIVHLDLLNFSHPGQVGFVKNHNHLCRYVDIEYFFGRVHFENYVLFGVRYLIQWHINCKSAPFNDRFPHWNCRIVESARKWDNRW